MCAHVHTCVYQAVIFYISLYMCVWTSDVLGSYMSRREIRRVYERNNACLNGYPNDCRHLDRYLSLCLAHFIVGIRVLLLTIYTYFLSQSTPFSLSVFFDVNPFHYLMDFFPSCLVLDDAEFCPWSNMISLYVSLWLLNTKRSLEEFASSSTTPAW